MIEHKNKANYAYLAILTALIIGGILLFYFLRGQSITGHAIYTTLTEPETNPSLVLYLSFDDPANPWKDYSQVNHTINTVGNVTWSDSSFCKYYGCVNLTSAGSKYLNTTVSFYLNDTLAWCAWVYHDETPSGTVRPGYFGFGTWTTLTFKDLFEDNNGFAFIFNNQTNNEVGYTFGYSAPTGADAWHFLCFQKNNTNMTFWRDAEVVVSYQTNNIFGATNLTDILKIGEARYAAAFDGYMDEVLMWNASVLNTTYVTEMYDAKRLGTPPDKDAYIKSVKYDLLGHRNWNSNRKELDINTNFQINITIANAGVKNATGNFNWVVVLDDAELCNGIVNIGTNSEQMVQCNWTTSMGFHQGYILLNIHDDNSQNNNISLYIPYLNHPYWIFNQSDWDLGYSKISSDPVTSYNFQWTKSWGTNNFTIGTTCDNADTWANNARNGATVCYLNNYTNVSAPNDCNYALTNILGYANIDPTTCTSVQSDHYYGQVILALDLMYNNMTKEQVQEAVAGLENKCQKFTEMVNLQNDNNDIIAGDNGKGFGAGMGTICYGIMGEYSENPLTIQNLSSQYWGKSMYDMWMDREINFLRSFKNDSNSEYQEGMGYKFYSQYHLADNLLYAQRFNIRNYSVNYNNALCSMASEMVKNTLDFNYNGQTLRNDANNVYRVISRGDSYSYSFPTSNGNIDLLTYYGLLCNDYTIKRDIVYLREKYLNATGGANSNYGKLQEIFLWHLLKNQTGTVTTMPSYNVVFDNANDIFTIRDNYTYVNDTVIQVDDGEERGGGHSQAQGYFLYALGEPFLDYEQVPYEDDVRSEAWKNGISLQNASQTTEGTSGTFSASCGIAELNQYYGMQDCPSAYYSTNYPNYRIFPLQYGGDLENYVGTKDAHFAGVYVWRPYKNADPIKEYFVKFGNLLAKRTIVTNNQEGEIFHNFINIYDEFTETRNGNNLTFMRTRFDSKKAYLDIDVIYTTKPLILGGGLTDVNYCFAKTSCEGSNRGKGKYRRTYLYAAEENIDFILAHQWYYEGEKSAVHSIQGIDNGLEQNGNTIIFDTNNDGKSTYGTKESTGWAMAYNENEIAAFNTTLIKDGSVTLLSSNLPISVHINRSQDTLILTANTMKRDPYIDVPQTVRVTIDAEELTLNTDFVVTKNDEEDIDIVSQSGTTVTFDIKTSNMDDYYTIRGTATYTTEVTPVTEPQNPSSGGSGSGAGGGGSAPKVAPLNLDSGRISTDVMQNQKVFFTAKGNQHSIVVESLNETAAHILIQSSPIHDVIRVGQTKEYSLDSTLISVTLQYITQLKANFAITMATPSVASVEPTEVQQPAKVEEQPKIETQEPLPITEEQGNQEANITPETKYIYLSNYKLQKNTFYILLFFAAMVPIILMYLYIIKRINSM